jgi:hypothetical protein
VGLGDVVDKLLDEDGLATPAPPKRPISHHGRGKEVDDLDTGLENLGLGRLLDEGRGSAWMGRRGNTLISPAGQAGQ